MTPVRHSVQVRCPVPHAFAVFTERVDDWWPPSHRRAGGRIVLRAGPAGRLVERGADGSERVLGTTAAWSPPHRVAFDWHLGATAETATRVTISFSAAGGGTRVEVLHVEGPRPLPDWASTAAIFTRAWSHVLAALVAAAESP